MSTPPHLSFFFFSGTVPSGWDMYSYLGRHLPCLAIAPSHGLLMDQRGRISRRHLRACLPDASGAKSRHLSMCAVISNHGFRARKSLRINNCNRLGYSQGYSRAHTGACSRPDVIGAGGGVRACADRQSERVSRGGGGSGRAAAPLWNINPLCGTEVCRG